jgi:hypothetical protein
MLAFSAEAGFAVSRWNHPTVIEFRNYDETEVRSAVRAVVDRHEILRTRIGQMSGRHCQVVTTGDQWEHRVLPATDRSSEELAAAEAARPFDLYEGPLARSLVAPRPDGGALLVLTYNHLVSDRESEALVAAELVARLEDPGLAPPPPPPQFGEFARWQRAEVSRYARSPEDVRRWREYEDVVRRMDPSAGPVPQRLSQAGDARGIVAIRFTEDALATLTTCAASHGVTPNTVILTAFAAALRGLPGTGLLLGEKTARNPYRFARTPGPFADLWAVDRSEVGDDLAHGLGSVQRQVLRAMDGAMPFLFLVRRIRWLARELVQPEHGRWVFYQYFSEPPVREGVRVTAVRFPDTFGVESGIFALHTQALRDTSGLTIQLAHRLDTLTPRDVDAFTHRMEALLTELAGRPVGLDRLDSRPLTVVGPSA